MPFIFSSLGTTLSKITFTPTCLFYKFLCKKLPDSLSCQEDEPLQSVMIKRLSSDRKLRLQQAKKNYQNAYEESAN